jgi:hypothetical protein
MASTNPFAGKDNPGIPERQKPRRGQRGLPKRSTPEAIKNWERDVECVRLRKADVDWHDIVEMLGYNSIGHAESRYKHVLKEYPREDAEAMRDLEILAIKHARSCLADKVKAGDVRAIEVFFKGSDRLCELVGINAPERKEITVLTQDMVEQALLASKVEWERLSASLPPKMIEMVQSAPGSYETVTRDDHPRETP